MNTWRWTPQNAFAHIGQSQVGQGEHQGTEW